MIKEGSNLTGVKETMLIPLYARAWASKQKNPEFIDEVALTIINNLDYDFKKWKASKLNIWGCAARTVIIDNITIEYIKKRPNCTIINLASGLDDRFSRVDNGKIKWYNIDLKEIIDLRNEIIEENPRVKNLTYDIFDYKWMDEIEEKENVLLIFEGILMYVQEYEAKALFDKIALHFKNPILIVELMTKWMVDHQKLQDVTIKTDSIFTWGVDSFKVIEDMCPEYEYLKDFNITDYMKLFSGFVVPMIYPFLKNKNNRIVVYKLKNKAK